MWAGGRAGEGDGEGAVQLRASGRPGFASPEPAVVGVLLQAHSEPKVSVSMAAHSDVVQGTLDSGACMRGPRHSGPQNVHSRMSLRMAFAHMGRWVDG